MEELRKERKNNYIKARFKIKGNDKEILFYEDKSNLKAYVVDFKKAKIKELKSTS